MLLLKSKLERKKHATYTPLPLFDENQHQNLIFFPSNAFMAFARSFTTLSDIA
jgi:hypothetical protein